MLASVSRRYPEPKGRFPRVTHPCATKAEAFVRLACVRHAASVRSEPGSNSQVQAEPRSLRTGRSLERVAKRPHPSFRNCCLLLLDRDAQATRDASPFRNRSAANGQNRRLRIPSHNTVSTISKIPRPLRRTAARSALRHRSSVRRVGALYLEDPKQSVKPLFSRRPTLLRLVFGASAVPLPPSRFSAAPASWEPGYRRVGLARQELFSSPPIFPRRGRTADG